MTRRSTFLGLLAVVTWIAAENFSGFGRRILAWDLSASEARRVSQARITELRTEGYRVINPAGVENHIALPAGEVS